MSCLRCADVTFSFDYSDKNVSSHCSLRHSDLEHSVFGLFDGGAGVVGVVRVVLDGFVEQLLERVRCILHQLKHTQRTRSDQMAA